MAAVEGGNCQNKETQLVLATKGHLGMLLGATFYLPKIGILSGLFVCYVAWIALKDGDNVLYLCQLPWDCFCVKAWGINPCKC